MGLIHSTMRVLLPIWIAATALGAPADPALDADHPFPPLPHEAPGNPPAEPWPLAREPSRAGGPRGFDYVQVNVDENGDNFIGDAANEPSIAVDPTNPLRIVIGWRQFNSVTSSFRQAGYGYSRDGGRSWTFPGVLEKNVFRSDPVLDSDSAGVFYYNSLTSDLTTDVFRSTDGGATWSKPVSAGGGDKQWMVIDRTDGIGRGHIYSFWSPGGCCGERTFNRSVNGGDKFEAALDIPSSPVWGTMTIGSEGEVYLVGDSGDSHRVARTDNARDRDTTPTFETFAVKTGGDMVFRAPLNPEGLLGQLNIAADRSDGETRGNVYVLASLRADDGDPLDVRLTRSTDRGKTWSDSTVVNDVRTGWQWLGAMSVAPNGRIDAVWLDTRDSEDQEKPKLSALYYASSSDAGQSWSPSTALTPTFDHTVGYPRQPKMGDYITLVSDYVGADVAFAATLNDEQDVWYVRIGDRDCNQNAIGDATEISDGRVHDVNRNTIPDECENLGDLNCSGSVDFDDIDPFVLALTDPADYGSQFPDCDIQRGDTNGDQSVDFDDIDGFVELLL